MLEKITLQGVFVLVKSVKSFFYFRRSKKIFSQLDKLFFRKKHLLDLSTQDLLQEKLDQLKQSIKQNQKDLARSQAIALKDLCDAHFPTSVKERFFSSVGSIVFALGVAIVVRQMWFELYTIPTGSMRPTLKESDFLVVSKTDFSLNVPLQARHFTFDPNLVQRGSIVVWTGENMDITDADTVYFYLFPGKKQFVKRLMGKPGDSLYFYGGKVYGVDAEGNEINEFLNASWAENLEHIPFIHLEGKVDANQLRSQGVFTEAVFSHVGIPIAKMNVNSFGFVSGDTLPIDQRQKLEHLSDYFGLGNFAMARLLTPQECKQLHPKNYSQEGDFPLYLELTHHMSAKNGKMVRDEQNRLRPDIGSAVSILGLSDNHIQAIMDHMTTCRFSVKNGVAYRLGMESDHVYFSQYYPKLAGVEDGTYEIQNGQGYRVYPLGYTVKLPKDHPLMVATKANVHQLFNLGIEFLTQYLPSKNTRAHPSRYAYFRNGDLCLLNAPIVLKNEPVLQKFIESELEKEKISTTLQPYLAFKDRGAPILPSGKLDKEKILSFGLKVPQKNYLMLGDNHAMSADSRIFGFVPETNLKGCVGFLFSPLGERFGFLPQPDKNHTSFPNVFVWSVFACISFVYFGVRRKIDSKRISAIAQTESFDLFRLFKKEK